MSKFNFKDKINLYSNKKNKIHIKDKTKYANSMNSL